MDVQNTITYVLHLIKANSINEGRTGIFRLDFQVHVVI